GVHVEAITFLSPFFGTGKGEKAAKALGVPHHIIDFTEDILEQVQTPAHGLGKAMNPCIDCHTYMIMRAGELLEKRGFDFIATGEVLAQRPMSQNKQSLSVVARCSKYEDLLVRPLSAALLPPTKPIREGWIDVDKLPQFSGRNRTPQMELARHFGIVDYPTPAGGCLLTEPRFGQKLKDVLDHEGPDADRTNIWLLPTGRHIRLADDVKIIVGTDQADNDLLEEKAHPEDYRIACPDLPSPTVIAPPNSNDEQLETAAAICARYAKTPKDQPCEVQISRGKESRIVEVLPMDPEAVKALMITP
ncbi:MAG: tRNA 4-thiouridine(8) synthase ThiI, partial [Verrucomicrobia bacterium]